MVFRRRSPPQHVMRRWSIMVDMMLQYLITSTYLSRGVVAVFHQADRQSPWIHGPKVNGINQQRFRRHGGVFTGCPKISPTCNFRGGELIDGNFNLAFSITIKPDLI